MQVTLGEDGSAGSIPPRPRRPPDAVPGGNMGDCPPLRLPLFLSRRLSDGRSSAAGAASAAPVPPAPLPPPAPAPAPLRPGLNALEEAEGRRPEAEGREVKQMKSSVPPPPPRSKCFLRRIRRARGQHKQAEMRELSL